MENKKTSSQEEEKTIKDTDSENQSKALAKPQVKEMLSKSIKDNSHIYLHTKGEKVVAAVHLVTTLIDREEPLKRTLRENVLVFFEKVSNLGELKSSQESKENILREVIHAISKVHSLLEVARLGGLVSEMNSEIIQQECQNIAQIAYEEAQRGQGIMLPESFFDISEELHFLSTGENSKDESEEGEPLDQISRQKDNIKDKTIADKRTSVKDSKYKGHSTSGSKGQVSKGHSKKTSAGKDTTKDRREKVITVLKSRGESNIKDISGVITECSPKTIQRDLKALVKKGIVEQRGERRWSTYVLKK